MSTKSFKVLVAAALLSAVAPSAHAQLSTAKLEAWLSGYREAWEKRDAGRAAELFTENARYQEMPFDAPKSGRAGIREYWSGVTADQRDVEFQSQTIAVNGNTGVAHWSAKFKQASTGMTVELDGVFVLEFDPKTGLCSTLREWWHVRGG
jgi:ketosteroid isomerase-like protein